MNDEIKYEYKDIKLRAKLTYAGRQGILRSLVKKMAKKGWELANYSDGGLTNISVATFKRDIQYQEPKKQSNNILQKILQAILYIILGLLILIFLVATFADVPKEKSALETSAYQTELKKSQKPSKKEQKKKIPKQNNNLNFIIKDILMDENNNNKILDAVSMRWITKNHHIFDLTLNKNNFKKGFTYIGSHKKDEYYNKYITNLSISVDTDTAGSKLYKSHYAYTPTIEDCEIKIQLTEMNKKTQILKFKINATLVNKLKESYSVDDVFTIVGKDFTDLEKLLK